MTFSLSEMRQKLHGGQLRRRGVEGSGSCCREVRGHCTRPDEHQVRGCDFWEGRSGHSPLRACRRC